MEQRYFSVEEIAKYLGLAPKTVYVMAEEGRLPSYKIGRLRRFDMEEIDRFIKNGYNSGAARGVERNGDGA
jgi:excisionase family DNA binding protein